jgi:hypothetical protein
MLGKSLYGNYGFHGILYSIRLDDLITDSVYKQLDRDVVVPTTDHGLPDRQGVTSDARDFRLKPEISFYNRSMRLVRGVAAALLALRLALPVFAAQTEEAELKAAYLYNFLKLTEWPAIQAGDPMDLCVANRNPFGAALDALQSREVQDKPVRVRVLEPGQRPDGCRMLFIPDDANAGDAQSWLTSASGTAALTVSDRPGFIAEGGMIGLITEDNKLRFEVNLEPVRRNRLNLRAQLLQLAVRVEGMQP